MRSRDIAMVAVLIFLSGATGYLARRGIERDSTSPAAGAKPAEHSPSGSAAKETRTYQKKPSLQESSKTSPLPPAGAPLKDTFDDLKRRADAGDQAAGTRLFRDVTRCKMWRELRRSVAVVAPSMLDAKIPENVDNAESSAQLLGMLSEDLDWVRSRAPLCEQALTAQLDSYPDVMLRAAELGDSQARDCYLDVSYFNIGNVMQHPQWLEQFRQSAPELIDQGVNDGDWKVIFLLRNAYDDFENGAPLLSQLIAPNPALAYRYTRLMQLGKENNKLYDQRLAALEQQLSADAISASEAWAQDAYQRYFRSSPIPVGTLHQICPSARSWPDS